MTALLIQSMQVYDSVLLIGPGTGDVVLCSKKERPALEYLPVRGHYVDYDGCIAMLYRKDDALRFRVRDGEYVWTEDSEISLERGKVSVLRLWRPNATGMFWDYAPPQLDKYDVAITAMNPLSEGGDFDFGLFVYNVLTDPERRELIYRDRH
jgi:hypothetical protein